MNAHSFIMLRLKKPNTCKTFNIHQTITHKKTLTLKFVTVLYNLGIDVFISIKIKQIFFFVLLVNIKKWESHIKAVKVACHSNVICYCFYKKLICYLAALQLTLHHCHQTIISDFWASFIDWYLMNKMVETNVILEEEIVLAHKI